MSMTLLEFKSRAVTYYKAKASVYVKSPPGMGKSGVMLEVPALLERAFPGKKFGIATLNAAGASETDATGFLVPVKGDGANKPRSEFTEPAWMITDEGKHMREYDGGIFFVDEMDKAPLEVKKMLGEAAHSRRFASHTLPPGWLMWGAGNRAMDRSGSTKELDHLINRRMERDIRFDLDSQREYMEGVGALPELLTFVIENVGAFDGAAVPKEQGPYLTPRSLMEVNDLLAVMRDDNNGVIPDDATTIEDCAGYVGHAQAAMLFAMIRLGMELPPVEAIIADPKGVKVPKRADAQMMTAYKLAHAVDATNAGVLTTFMDRKEMPQEFAVTFLRAATKAQPKLALQKDIAKWCQTNARLMAIIGRLRDNTQRA